MEITFGWLSLVIGIIGSSLSCILAGKAARCTAPISPIRKGPMILGTLSVVLTVMIFSILALQTTGGFSRGQTLGFGFLIGGAAAVVAMIESRRTGFSCSDASHRARSLALLSMAFFGVFVSSLMYVLFSGYPQNALMGAAIGTCLAGIMSRLMAPDRSEFSQMLTDVFCMSVLITSGSVILSVLHFNSDVSRIWWSIPLLVGASSCVSVFIGVEISGFAKSESGSSVLIASLIAAVITTGLCVFYSMKIAESWDLLKVAAISVFIWGIICWQAAAANTRPNRPAAETSSVVYLLVLAFIVAAFKQWTGLGISIGITAGFSVLIPALAVRFRESDANYRILMSAIWITIAAILFRIFLEYYRPEVSRTDVRIHYMMVGSTLAVLVPILLSTIISSSHRAVANCERFICDLGLLIASNLTGLFAAVLPIVMLLIWGIKSSMGLVFGLIAAQILMGFAITLVQSNGFSTALKRVPLLLIGSQLVAIQFTGPMLSLELTRSVRMWILIISMVVFAVWMFVTDIAAGRKEDSTCKNQA